MSNFIVFTANLDLGLNPIYGGVTYTRSGPVGSIYTYTANTEAITIANNAFQTNTNITSITIPSGVTTIGNYTFSGCTSLTSVTIPDSVTTIGTYAFQNCSSLTSITIPNSVTIIRIHAFQNCSSLNTITFPYKTNVNSTIFYGCPLTTINFQVPINTLLYTIPMYNLYSSNPNIIFNRLHTPPIPDLRMKSLFTNNSQVYYKPGSLASCGIGSVRNSSAKTRRL